jgi:hypothetical protein
MSELPSRHPEALLEEIARLKADNARLKAEVEAQAKRWAESEDLISHYKEQRDEVINDCQCSRLKAEVERLTKAGDAMAEDLLEEFGRKEMLKYQPYQDWNAAKEGKQSQ